MLLVLTHPPLSRTGGDGGWYNGTVKKCFQNGDCSIRYDDGDSWTGSASHVHLVGGGAAPMGGMQMGMPMQPQVGVAQPQMGMVVAPASVVAPGQVIQPAMGQALPMQPQGALPCLSNCFATLGLLP